MSAEQINIDTNRKLAVGGMWCMFAWIVIASIIIIGLVYGPICKDDSEECAKEIDSRSYYKTGFIGSAVLTGFLFCGFGILYLYAKLQQYNLDKKSDPKNSELASPRLSDA